MIEIRISETAYTDVDQYLFSYKKITRRIFEITG